MVVYGIDFTSAPSRTKPLTQAVCRLSGDLLKVDEIRRLPGFEDLEEVLNQPGPWIAALDFPFGMPKKLIENQDWPLCWAGYVGIVAGMTKREFENRLRDYQRKGSPGDKRLLRVVDRHAGSRSPMQLDFTPVAKMFYQGAPRLLRSKANVVPFVWKDDNTGIAVEGYPCA
jgi:hypothetical protein